MNNDNHGKNITSFCMIAWYNSCLSTKNVQKVLLREKYSLAYHHTSNLFYIYYQVKNIIVKHFFKKSLLTFLYMEQTKVSSLFIRIYTTSYFISSHERHISHLTLSSFSIHTDEEVVSILCWQYAIRFYFHLCVYPLLCSFVCKSITTVK